jgi:hypothetical protein
MNEPAFPNEGFNGWGSPFQGMTLRDYFAAKAIQGFLAYAAHKGIYAPPDDELASASYQLADAMLKAREA